MTMKLKFRLQSAAFLFFVFFHGALFCSSAIAKDTFPAELTQFKPVKAQPIFKAAGVGHWDVKHRERGWILRDGKKWHLWFTGYDGTREGKKMLGYASSTDGIKWKRHPKNPIYRTHWVEDMMVVKQDGIFHMFAEGKDDICQRLTSSDGIHWKRVGPLDIRKQNGKPISAGPRGTPTAFYNNGTWYLFYERYDQAVWLATSKDMQVWTNVSDEPVLKKGPGESDREMIALNQIIKYQGRYYAYYHGSGSKKKPRFWTTNVAVSSDLIHWKKFAGNPLLPTKANKSSGILVYDGKRFRLYTMHDEVHLHGNRK
jgi:beta-1,2-mannobiose phosphorylase / 1,2-beta-oligomannan phosphorylase